MVFKMSDELFEIIKLQQQPNDNTCVSTCMAMILDEPADTVINDFHQGYIDPNVTNKVTDYLNAYGLPYTVCNFETPIVEKGVYLVTVPSVNTRTALHNIVVVGDDSGYSIYDPNAMRNGVKSYSFGEIDELLENEVKFSGYSVDLFISKQDYLNWRQQK